MFREQPAQVLALRRQQLQQSKLINIGGRPVIAPSPTRNARHEPIKVAPGFAAIYLVWGSTYLAIRYAVETIPPLVTAGIRHSIDGGIFLAGAWTRCFLLRRAH